MKHWSEIRDDLYLLLNSWGSFAKKTDVADQKGNNCTAQKIKFYIKDFFSKSDQIRRKLRIWSLLLKKSLMENFIFCAVLIPFCNTWQFTAIK